MKSILISSENNIKNESFYINRLFEEGMKRFHLRKPNWNKNQVEDLLFEIQPEYYSKIVIHSFYELVDKFKIGGFHLSEKTRVKTSSEELKEIRSILNKEGQTLSTSFHDWKNVFDNKILIDYGFYSPVFNSISKENYIGKNIEGPINKDKVNFEIFALGGITDKKVLDVKNKGFDGCAVLGFIWKNPELYLSNYLKLKEVCLQLDQQFSV